MRKRPPLAVVRLALPGYHLGQVPLYRALLDE